MITRHQAIQSLSTYVGKSLEKLAINYNITIQKNGKINKGWAGLTLERLAGLSNNSKKAPNGLGFELKSVPYYLDKNGYFTPKETMAITMFNSTEVAEQPDFYKSHLWEKTKSLVICVKSWYGPNQPSTELLKVYAMDLEHREEIIDTLENDYLFFRQKLITHGFDALTGSDGQLIQVRTKGEGHGSNSRAFYARKEFLKAICPPFKLT
jgi:DNA mismatch repair protein MutH